MHSFSKLSNSTVHIQQSVGSHVQIKGRNVPKKEWKEEDDKLVNKRGFDIFNKSCVLCRRECVTCTKLHRAPFFLGVLSFTMYVSWVYSNCGMIKDILILLYRSTHITNNKFFRISLSSRIKWLLTENEPFHKIERAKPCRLIILPLPIPSV